MAAPGPEQESVGRRNLDAEVEGVGVADEAERGTRFESRYYTNDKRT